MSITNKLILPFCLLNQLFGNEIDKPELLFENKQIVLQTSKGKLSLENIIDKDGRIYGAHIDYIDKQWVIRIERKSKIDFYRLIETPSSIQLVPLEYYSDLVDKIRMIKKIFNFDQKIEANNDFYAIYSYYPYEDEISSTSKLDPIIHDLKELSILISFVDKEGAIISIIASYKLIDNKMVLISLQSGEYSG